MKPRQPQASDTATTAPKLRQAMEADRFPHGYSPHEQQHRPPHADAEASDQVPETLASGVEEFPGEEHNNDDQDVPRVHGAIPLDQKPPTTPH